LQVRTRPACAGEHRTGFVGEQTNGLRSSRVDTQDVEAAG
jgi:hypothetical protein